MKDLKENSFASTQEHAKQGRGNIDPRKAYMQKPAVKLSSQGLHWLNTRLEEAFSIHGCIPQAELEELDWPQVE